MGDVGVRGGNLTHECARPTERNSARAVGDSGRRTPWVPHRYPIGTQLVARTCSGPAQCPAHNNVLRGRTRPEPLPNIPAHAHGRV